MKIISLNSREILDSSGNPTIEVEIQLATGAIGYGRVPSGVSTGSKEAFVLRDEDPTRYNGKGILKALKKIEGVIKPSLVNQDFESQEKLDQKLINLDGTKDKSNLGGNTLLAVSIAFANAMANARNIPLYEYLAGDCRDAALGRLKSRQETTQLIVSTIRKLPKPMMVMIEGGKHGDNSTDFQEFLIKPSNLKTTTEQVRAGQEVRIKLTEILKAQGYSTNVGLEGAFCPSGISDNERPLVFLKQAIKSAGYSPNEISLGLDIAANELFNDRHYQLKTNHKELNSDEMIQLISELCQKYRITSIEDGLSESDVDNWPKLKNTLAAKDVVCIGDDLTVTDPLLIEEYAKKQLISGVIIKMNQIGTITESIQAIKKAKEYNLQIIISHRGSETNDTTLVDLAVAYRADYIKVGPTRGERVIKYNRLMKIANDFQL